MLSRGSGRRTVVLQAAESSLDLCTPLGRRGWEVTRHGNLRGYRSRHGADEPAVGIVVIDGPDRFAPDELAELLATDRSEWLAVVSRDLAVAPALGRILANGFYDFHTLPLDLARLEVVMGHVHGRLALRQRFAETESRGSGRYGLIGRSGAMHALYRAIDKVARVDAPLLISGESGTGKEVVARAVHDHSERRDGPFVAVNCAALPAGQVQSELFGREPGVVTPASPGKAGSIAAATGGTIFLDGISDLPLYAQAGLLRFLEERAIVLVGASRPVHVDARVIASTRTDLATEVRRGRFREDLFYRLNVLHVAIPPLRERPGDVLLLADHVFELHAAHKTPNVRGFSGEARAGLETHDWPGNVRELFNRVRKAMIMCEGPLIMPNDLGLPDGGTTRTVRSLEQARCLADRDLILNALDRNRQNMAATARQLGISRVTLYRLVHKLAIDRRRGGSASGEPGPPKGGKRSPAMTGRGVAGGSRFGDPMAPGASLRAERTAPAESERDAPSSARIAVNGSIDAG